ncbi:MAG: methionyl-tRNA formyltransferase [Pirellulales bacterium]
MKIIVMGTGPFAVPSCRALQAAGHEIALVVTRPPVPASGKKAPDAPVAEWAQSQGLPLFQPASINEPDALDRLRSLAADLLFVCDYGQILSRDCLTVTPLGGINLHGSLLPRHRGAAPVQWTLLSGDETAGVSVIHMTPGLDAGPVLSVFSTPVARDENAGELEKRLSSAGTQAVLDAIDQLAKWDRVSEIGVKQDKAAATKAPRLSRQDGRLDCATPAIELERRVRGLQPWPGVFGELEYPEGKRISLHLRSARAMSLSHELSLGEPGTVRSAKAYDLGLDWTGAWSELLAVETVDGTLLINLVQPAGKRPMPVADFLRGHPIAGTAKFLLPT